MRPSVATTLKPRSLQRRGRSQRRWYGLLFGGLLIWALLTAGIGVDDLINERGWPLTARFLRASLHPDLSAPFLLLALESTLTTLAYAVCGSVVSLGLGLVGGLLASEVWWQTWAGAAAPRWRIRGPLVAIRTLIAVPRAIHEIIWGLLLINIIGLDPLVAVLALGLPFGAVTAKVFADILDETPRDSLDALRNSGVPPLKALVYSLYPQALPDLISYTFYRFECAIRAVTVLGLIGAGGLGYQILLSLQSLRYEQMWTFLLALILLSGLIDVWGTFVRRQYDLANRIDLNTAQLSGCQPRRPRRPASSRLMRGSILGVAGLIPWAFWYIDADWSKLVSPRTWRLLSGVARDAWPPLIDAPFLGQLGRSMSQTLAMSILAMSFAGAVGLLLSFGAARNLVLPGGVLDSTVQRGRGWWRWLIYGSSRGVLLLCRAISEPIWALLVLFVVFPGILPGALGLGIYNLGIVGRLMAEVAENTDPRPLQALQAQGVARPQIFLYGVLPTTLPKSAAYVLYRWEVCIRATVVVGLVGAGGLGRLLTEQLSSLDYHRVTTTLLAFIALTLAVDAVSSAARRSLR
ncbi:MAG: ABC transporter permease subunit [Herpetosiphonaceae bacterium]|nr:ABC transporter permease subunit [Herpetosiphonaceae bacterium]